MKPEYEDLAWNAKLHCNNELAKSRLEAEETARMLLAEGE